MLKNKLNYFRHQLCFNKQKEFAVYLGVSKYSLNRWESQIVQPDVISLWKIYLKLKESYPELHLEELFETATE